MMLIPSNDTSVAFTICFFQRFFVAGTVPFMASSIAISAGASAPQYRTGTAALTIAPPNSHGSFLSVVDLSLSMYTKRKEHANMPLDLLAIIITK